MAHGPTQLAFNVAQMKTARSSQKRRHVFSIRSATAIAPCNLQSRERKDFGIETVGITAHQGIGSIVTVTLKISADNAVDDFRVDQRTIARNANDDIGALVLCRVVKKIGRAHV